MRRRRLMPTRRARRGVARDGPGGELALPSLLRREFASLLQLLRGADRVIPRQHVTGAAAVVVLLLVEEIGVVRSRRGGPGLGPAAARARSLGAVEGVGAHGADGLRGWLPRGSARELARPTTRGGTGRDRVRSWRAIPSSLRRGAYGESTIGAKDAHGRRGIRRRMRGRNASIGHARACRGADGPGHGSRVENGAGAGAGGGGKGRLRKVRKDRARFPLGRKRGGIGGIRPGADTR